MTVDVDGPENVIGSGPALDEVAQEIADRKLFERIADPYSQKDLIASTRLARHAIVRRAVRPVLEEANTLGVVVDIGCGIGAQADYLDGNFERYLGIDYAAALIKIGKTFNRARVNVEFISSNVKDQALPQAIADTVLVVGALHHMSNLNAVMKALQRLAKSGAHFVAIEPQRGNPVIQGMRRIRMQLDPAYSSDQQFFSRDEIREIMNAVPMTDVRVEYQGFLTPPFAQAGTKPWFVFLPLSKLACLLEPAMELLCFGPFGRLSWNIVAYGRFA